MAEIRMKKVLQSGNEWLFIGLLLGPWFFPGSRREREGRRSRILSDPIAVKERLANQYIRYVAGAGMRRGLGPALSP